MVSENPTPAKYVQLLEEYGRPEEEVAVLDQAEKELVALDYVQVLVSLADSTKHRSDYELLDKIHSIYDRVTDSPEKLRSLNHTVTAIQEHQPQYAEVLLKQATQLCGSLAAKYARQGSLDEAREIAKTMRLVNRGVDARLEAVSCLGDHVASPALLNDAMRDASSSIEDDSTKTGLFRAIRSKAIEVHAFADVDFAVEFIGKYVELSGAETQEIKEVYGAIPASIDKLSRLLPIVTAIENRVDLRDALLEAMRSEALEVGAFNNVDFVPEFIKQIAGLPGVEPISEVEEVLRSVEEPTQQLEILFEIIPEVQQDLASYVAQRSLELVHEADSTAQRKRRNLKRLLSLAERQHILIDEGFCQRLILDLVEVAEFEDARRALKANVTLYQDVALETSGEAPGFALEALGHMLELDRSLAYSERHTQVLARIVHQVTKYSPGRAKCVRAQAIEAVRRLVPHSVVRSQKRLTFYRESDPIPNPRIANPARIPIDEDEPQPIAVRIVLAADFGMFIETKEQLFIEQLADMLRIAPSDVLIINRSEGSTKYVLYLIPQSVSYILKQKFEIQDEDMRRLQIEIDAPILALELILVTEAQVESVPSRPVTREGGLVEIELEGRAMEEMATIRIRLPDGTEDKSFVELPFDEEGLTAILKTLEGKSLEDRVAWSPSQIEALHRLGLVGNPVIAQNVPARVAAYFAQLLRQRRPRRFSLILNGSMWLTILMALAYRLGMKRGFWKSYQIGMLYEMDLINIIDLIPTHLREIGNMLYHQNDKGLASSTNIYHRLQTSLERSVDEDTAWQLKMDKVDTHLTRYPWELISNEGRHLLLDNSSKLDLARSVLPCGAARAFEVSLPLNILYIESRPYSSKKLPRSERRVVEDALKDLRKTRLVDLTVLSSSRQDLNQSPPTFVHVLDYLSGPKSKDFHVIHFDGHGQFGRRCPKCGRTYYPHYQTCAEGCHADLGPPQGFLQFENIDRSPEWISCDDLFYLLGKSSVRLVVLSACFSGMVWKETAFSGVAPALLERGIPCVVGMQLSLSYRHTEIFFRRFYKSLVESGNVRKAMRAGRRSLLRKGSWFAPVLYLRTRDFLGQLFDPTA
jgi:hypothetical protein